MDRLFKLAKKKEKLNKKLDKIQNKIREINKEALTYTGRNPSEDLFISCIVNNLHFEQVPLDDVHELECGDCNCGYKMVPNKEIDA